MMRIKMVYNQLIEISCRVFPCMPVLLLTVTNLMILCLFVMGKQDQCNNLR